MFIDEAVITAKGGNGGDGCVAFFANKSGPSGGNGGRGGNVYAILDNNVTQLRRYTEINHFQAEDGQAGGSNRRLGAAGADLRLLVPAGTTIIDTETKDETEINNQNPKVLLCEGGVGGVGNDAQKTSTYRTPRTAKPGLPGQERHLKLILKLIADYGLIGLPNAGKSSLLNELTAANVKTAPYPFTTLEPNLGVVNGRIIADVPGLIEGASSGKGLGVKFLKHIEKVKLLLHCISVESENIDREYRTVINEMAKYNPQLTEKPAIILLTKIDLITPKQVKEKISFLKKFQKTVLPISIHDWNSLQKLKESLS